MPAEFAMTNELILDLAVVAVAALFAIIGFIRGVQREVFATAAILGGWAMASAWTSRWQSDLAELVAISERTAGFILTAAILAGSLVILGWGAGGVVGAPPRSPGQRVAGAVLGAINGVLLASYGLSTYSEYLSGLSGRRLIESSRVARVIRDELPYALAIGMALAVALTVIALAVGGSGKQTPLPTGRPYPAPARKESLAYQDEEYKVEPVRRPVASGLDNTMPIAPVDPGRLSDTGGRRQMSRFKRGDDREWVQIQGAQATSPIPIIEDDEEHVTTVSCVSCGQAVTLADVYCPWCGKLTR